MQIDIMANTRFYKYFFKGIEKPVIMEADSREQADEMLGLLSEKSNVNIEMSKLEDLRIEVPLLGISTKKRLGKQLVWVGKNKTQDGWMDKSEYESKTKK